MMKIILLLAFAVFVSGAPMIEDKTLKDEKTLLRELLHNLETAKKNLPKETEGEKIFVEDLTEDGTCPKDVFCKAEQELKLKVSGLSKYEDFRTDKILMRNLHEYNLRYGATCDDKPVAKGPVQIILRDFLKKLKNCAQMEFAKK